MQITARLGREYATQVISFVISLLDRIVIAGLLLRIWGVADFAAWSIAMAAAGLVSTFDLGVNLYFANRLLFLVQQGKIAAAKVILRAGNFWMAIASLTGLLIIMTTFGLFGRELASSFSVTIWLAALLLSASAAIRMAQTIQLSLYRAHAQYARQTMLLVGLDAVRIAVTIGAVLAGGHFILVAGLQLAVTVTAAVWILFFDSRRRFSDYPFGMGQVPGSDRREAFVVSAGYWVQSAPSTLLAFLPVFLMSALGAVASAVAQFVLMRTAANFVRAVLQMFAVVLGQESARRIAIGDQQGLSKTYRDAAVFLAAQTACAAGILMAVGRPLFNIWTGRPALYDPYLLWLAILPPLLIPSATLAQTLLATANVSWPIATGRIAQVSLTVGLFFFLPIESDALRVMAALAIGELVGFGLPISRAAYRLVPSAGLGFHLEVLWRGLLCFAVCFAVAAGAMAMVMGGEITQMLVGSIAGGVGAAIAIMLLGFSASRRSVLISTGLRMLAR